MELEDIYNNRLDESLDKPYPICKRSQTTYDIDADGVTIRVFLNGAQIDGINCLSIKFVNPQDAANAMSATNTHGNAALRVFATLVQLIDPIKFNVLLCVAEDPDIVIQQKKSNLYAIIFRKLERLGKIHSVRTFDFNLYDKPVIVAERGVALDEKRIKNLVRSFVKVHDPSLATLDLGECDQRFYGTYPQLWT
jgi:hypothetical protein